MSFVDDVEQVVRRHANVADSAVQQCRIDDDLAVLCGSDSGGILWRRYRTYAIEMGRVDKRIERYRWLRSLEIAAAPDVVASFPIAEGAQVIVLRYWATREDEDLIPAATPGISFAPHACAQLRRDIDTLAKQHYYHRYAGRGLNYWSVGSESGVVTLHGWSALVQGTSGEDRAAVEALLAAHAGA